MRKLPFRAGNEISQMFNDGFVRIYKTVNTAEAGRKAVEGLVIDSVVKLPFEEQRVGINRYYLGKEAGIEIDKVFRIPRRNNTVDITPQDVAIYEGEQYRVEQVQAVQDVFPPSLDISLKKIEVVVSELV